MRSFLAATLVLASVLSFGSTGLSAPSDPLAVSGAQAWLARVSPVDLPPPSRPIPPIAVIEDGFDRTHPETQGGWLSQRRFGPFPSDDAGLIRLLEGLAHGTAVASVIGAPRNGLGIEGVLPGAQVWVYGTSGYCRDVAAAVRRAVKDGARIINVSAGFEPRGACRQLRDATSYAFGRDVLTVAAAGNYRPKQRWTQPGHDFHVLTVGALTAADQPASFSQQTNHLDVMAPGEGELVAWPTLLDDDGAPDGFTRVDGTSFAAPMVAAAAAWILSERPDLSADQLAEIIRYSARDLGRPGWDRAYGWGALDLRAALTYPAPAHDHLEPNEDIRWVNGVSGFVRAPALLGNRRHDAVRARLDVAKDPWDVYPVAVPPGRSATITLRLSGVAAHLFVWQPTARRASERGQLVARSRRPGLRTEQVTITNSGRIRLPAYVEVRAARSHALAGTYTLALRRN